VQSWQKNEMINDTINDTIKTVRQLTGNLKYPVFSTVTNERRNKMVKAYPAIIHCDLKIKNARPNKCFGGLRRTCQTCEQEQKRERHVSGLTAGRCTLRLLACQRSGFLILAKSAAQKLPRG
jgi:hypothetical protein